MLYPLSYGRLCSVTSCRAVSTRCARLRRACDRHVAEARGFEPPVPGKGDNSLAVSPIRPLWHASLNFLRVPDRSAISAGLPEPPRSTAYTGQTYAVEMTARLRPELAELPVYVPGKTVPGAIKLASNETVSGPLPSVRAAIERATDGINRYPDNGCADLKAALAKHLNSGRVGSAGGWGPEHIAAGCGSVSLCQQLIQITATAGDEVLFGWRSFEIYPLQVRLAGATAVQVPLADHTFDLTAMLAAVTDRTRLIFICNPNNPTSTVVDPAALARFVEAVPSHIAIAIDEAYVEYIRDGLVPDSLGLVREHGNVVVLRTFSKAYGLAGLRVGYAAGHPELITAMDKAFVPFTLSSISQAAAIASLDAADELLARTDAVVAERARVSDTLLAAGFILPSSQANFVWLPLGPRTQDFVQRAADARIVVRPYGTDGVRVTIGAPEENDALLQFAQGWI
jgi:histidinol-phosphate aminotransferase